MYTINRTFARRADTEALGTVTLKGEADLTLNGTKLPANSVEYLLTFALQSLQDAYAGATDFTAAQAAFESKLDKVLTGTIGLRTGGVDPWQSDARKVFRPIFVEAIKAKPALAAQYKEGDAEERNAMLDAAIEKNRAKVEPLVAALRAERAKIGEAADAIEL